MISKAKFDFPQEAPDRPFNTIPLSDLKHALIAKLLWNRIPRDPPKRKVRSMWSGNRFVWARRPLHPIVRKAIQRSEAEVLSDLRSGILISHITTEVPGIYRRIPNRYWREKYSGLSSSGLLLDMNEGETFSKEFIGSTIYVFELRARTWLLHQEIYEDNPAFPDCLRTRPASKTVRKTFEEVQMKMLAMIEAGLLRDEAAKQIGKLPGFAGVGNAYARDAVRGLIKPGPRPKKAASK